MEENKNLIIAVVLMLLVWFAFSILFPPARPVQPTQHQAAPASVPAVAPASLAVAPAPVVTPAVVVAAVDRTIEVETELYRARLSNTGARIVHLELKNYRQQLAKDALPVVLVEAPAPKLATLRLDGSGDFAFPPDIAFALQDERAKITLSGTATQDLGFRAVLPSGLVVERWFHFQAQSYGIDVETRILNGSSREVRGQLGLALIHPWSDEIAKNQADFSGSYALVGDKIKNESPSKILKNAFSYDQDLIWSGFKDKYFLTALAPAEAVQLKGEYRATSDALECRQLAAAQSLRPGETLRQKFLAYFGPLDLDILKAQGHQMDRAVDFGFFSILAKPLFEVLRFFYSFLGNYGLAIILLTVIIKLIFWPLTQKSYTSMKAMQKLQPEMQKLREKYKNDRERMNREVMELYKNHRVNPLGGCLPMLVQIPVFFALYQVLMIAIEMRQAPFYLWIVDLSLKDPYYVTPLIMGATMFIQQKMTPTAGIDPIQQKIFLFMPIIFTAMFLNFPAGLVLYWLINNLLTILQQYLINRKPA